MLNIATYLSERELFKVLDKYNVFDISTHGKKVSSYALRLFDSLNPCYEFKDEERNLLYYSAILHDIGYFINKEKHHKHTRYIILKEPLLDNVPSNLRDDLALIASGHGKSIDDSFDFYPNNKKIIILRLISLLRIADALDHKHNLHVSLEKVELKNDTLNIHIKGDDSNLILKKIKKRSSLFLKIFNLPIYMECT
ncbi:HD domain-containing protein [Clostridium sp.]|uniref:HD domain-containing protein n=1 Tax=Clostridium sp. TaxID=1506 RepID=UPI001A47B17B|nr:HD domain-containing protein [Clostridium sp.]MBK5235151.1 HD domain-containing protein [Clostridium sp.]